MSETLILTDEEVKQLLTMKEVLTAVEEAFRQKGMGHVQMPAKVYLHYRRHNGDLRAMPSYMENVDVSAVKVVNVHPDNPSKNGLPTVMATILLINPSTGAPLAIMGGTTITNMRTGAAGAIAAKYLAPRNSKKIAFIGAGAQARTQLDALLLVFEKLEEARVWSRSRETRDAFITEAKRIHRGACKFVPAESVEKAVDDADIIVTTTPSRTPLVMQSMVREGVHFNCIGADAEGKEELDPAILKKARIVVDDWEQAAHSGEINVPLKQGLIRKEDVYAEIGEVVAGLKPGRQSSGEVTVFVSTGLAVQDAAAAHKAYEKALEKNMGRRLRMV